MEMDPRCRACLEERPQTIRMTEPVFVDEKSYPLSELFVSCSNIKIYNDDQKPQILCCDCVEEAKRCFKFQKSCQWSDVILQDELAESTEIKEEPECEEIIIDNPTQMDEDTDTKMDIFEQLLEPKPVKIKEEPTYIYNQLKELMSFKQACKNCAQLFRSQAEFLRHTQQCSPTALQCAYCAYKSNKKSEMDTHVWRHTVPDMARRMCDICGRVLSSEKCLMSHKRSVHECPMPPKKWYNCNKCEFVSDRVAHLIRHYKELHADVKEFECVECGNVSLCHMSYSRHLHAHRRNFIAKKYNCDFCEYSCERHHDLRTHMLNHPKQNRQYNCPHCDKKFNQKFLYSCHLVVHTKKYQCHRCEFTCNGIVSIIRHYKENHPSDRELPCADCERIFSSLEELEKHFIAHSQYGKIYNCVSCCFSCTRKQDLRAHMVQHPKTKPFMCEDCGRQFSDKNAYNCHLILHTKKFRHYCKDCNEGFTERRQLQRHQKMHKMIGEVATAKEFPCAECGRVFNKSTRLKSHLLVHTGVKPYDCKICGKKYVQRRGLVWHMAKHHRVDKEGRPLPHIPITTDVESVR